MMAIASQETRTAKSAVRATCLEGSKITGCPGRNNYGLNHLHYITRSTYRRARLFDSESFKRQWVRTLDELRSELNFKIIGYVLMPEHFHILIWPSADPNPSQILQLVATTSW